MEIVRVDYVSMFTEDGRLVDRTVVRWVDDRGRYHVSFLEGKIPYDQVLSRLRVVSGV